MEKKTQIIYYLFYLMETIMAVEYNNQMRISDLLQQMAEQHIYYKSLEQQKDGLSIRFLDCVDLVVHLDDQNAITDMSIVFNCDEHQISWRFSIATDMVENYIAWKQPSRTFNLLDSTTSGDWKSCRDAEHKDLSVAANAFFSALQNIVKYQTGEPEEQKGILESMENVAGWNETYDAIGKSMERRWFIRSNAGSIIEDDCDICLTMLLNRENNEMIGATILMWPPADRDLFDDPLIINFQVNELNTIYHITVHGNRIEFLGDIEVADLHIASLQ